MEVRLSTIQDVLSNSWKLQKPPEGRFEESERRKKQERRLRLLRQSGHLGNDRSGSVYSRATTVEDLDGAYRLVHDVYVEMGYITKQINGLRMRPFELCPENATFVAKTSSHSIIGAISVIADSSDLGLPSDAVFKKEIDAVRGHGGKVCEMSNQAVLREFRRLGPGGELMRCAWAYAVAHDLTDVICAVTPQLIPLYETICFEQISSVKQYSDTTQDDVVLMCMPNIHLRSKDAKYYSDEIYKQLIDYYYTDNPYFGSIPIWDLLNQRMFNNEAAVATLLGKCPDAVLDSAVMDSLYQRLGDIFLPAQADVENKGISKQRRKMKWKDVGDLMTVEEKRAQSDLGADADFVFSDRMSRVSPAADSSDKTI